MKDALPRLYRSLETNTGREGADTIVSAAAASYASLRHPTEAQARDFGRLATPFWNLISVETKRTLAAALSHAPRMPRGIVDRLIACPVEVSAPFLLSSPCLTEADLATMAIEGDARLSQIVARRRTVAADAPPTAAPARETAAPIAEIIPLPVAPSDPTPREAAVPQTAEEAREMLRRLVQPGGRTGDAETPRTVADLLSLARHGKARAAYDGLAAMLALPRERLGAVEDEESGRLLAIALRVLRAGAADALTIVMLLKPAVARDVEAFESLKAAYRGFDPDACRGALGLPQAPPSPAPPLQPRLSDLDPSLRPEPRSVFGRRPADKGSGAARSA